MTACKNESVEMDWQLYYNEPIIVQKQTVMGELHLSIAKPESWDRQTWFYFHGAGGDLESWKSFAKKTLCYRKDDTFPNIVGISLGSHWFLVDSPSRKEIAGSSLFWQRIFLDVKEVVGEIGKPVAVGHSMGGFNALSLFLDNSEIWDAVVLLTPAIADLSPYAGQGEKIDYLKRTNAYSWQQYFKHYLFGRSLDTGRIDKILANWRRLARDDNEWQKINPLYRLQSFESAATTRFFLSCGKRDPFGFLDGTTRASKLLSEAGFKIETHFVTGGHMAIPYKKLSKFLEALKGGGVFLSNT
jgi:predicted esterase